ncbi:MAG: hypothetical protein E2576_10705 [Alcaligenaceae bacterium]|nr:hypothetical protein [Alcaligenaceae bacterium SAGV5]MPS55326.1 hypothetical protein [Alcaligenaceae bacterium SAGV3]MPT57181.1 hypothetical protein [Alcaligenaceae bacterium]
MNPTPDTSTLLTLQQIAAMLRARQRQILAITLAFLLLGMGVTLLLPTVWTASSDLYIDYKENDPISGRGLSAMLDDSYMQTQIDMIRSHVVAEEVIRAQGLDETVQYREQAQKHGVARAKDQLVERLVRNTQVEKARNSRVLSVSYDAPSADEAQRMTNAVVRAYVDVTLRVASSSARSLREQYSAQLDTLRAEADTIQEKLTQYRQQTGLIGDTENTDRDAQLLDQLTNALSVVQTRRLEAQTRFASLQGSVRAGTPVEQLPITSQITPLNDMRSRLNEIDRRLNEIRPTLGSRHPTLLGLEAERRELQQRIQTAARLAYQSTGAEADQLAAQERDLQRQIEQQRSKVLEQLQYRDRIASYQRQQASVEQVYRSALQKYDGLLMASNITAPNLAVLREAALPTSPSRPRLASNLVASLLAGLFIALSFAFLQELRHRKVRCLDDLRRSIPDPLLGQIGTHQGKERV